MGCDSTSPEKSQNIQWLMACATNDKQYVKDHMDQFKRSRESRQYDLAQIDGRQILIVPNFTGIMYAIHQDNLEIVELIADAELDLALHTDTYLPARSRVPFDQTFVQDQRARRIFAQNAVTNSVCVAQDSNLLELSLLLGNVKAFQLLLDKLSKRDRDTQKLLLRHCNQSSQNALLMLTALNTPDSYETLLDFGKLLIQNQFSLTNVYGDNGISYAHRFGNYKFLDYFLGLAQDQKYRHQCDRYVQKLRQMKQQQKCDPKSATKCQLLIENYKNKIYPDAPDWLMKKDTKIDPKSNSGENFDQDGTNVTRVAGDVLTRVDQLLLEMDQNPILDQKDFGIASNFFEEPQSVVHKPEQQEQSVVSVVQYGQTRDFNQIADD
ncbi:Conserved_hypothetical protein [Hexamita inflata]|uniref:Uncharacterized protein n=1 Tax=Hexamita inflata TaxID=28002 RepID=A0AA86QHN5_9EUKA|nr:Conserved hypothetical protein [Hexamita inflata]